MLRYLALFTILIVCSMGYVNPVQGLVDSPDPGVIYAGEYYYAATTGGGWNNKYLPIWRSKDLFSWEQISYGLWEKPVWAKSDFWAPQIHYVGSSFKLYYTARNYQGQLCIGIAESVNKPEGPYRDMYGAPLLRNSSEGVIDPTFFKHPDGTNYLVYKVDGNAHQKPTQIYAQELTQDGNILVGNNRLLIRDTQSWEYGIVEAPWFVYHEGIFYLFYSACGYHDKCYSLGVARSKKFFGPYEKHDGPILRTKPVQTSLSWEGPGHCSVVQTSKGNYAVVYHAWPHGAIGTKRVMLADQLTWVDDGWPRINDGSPSQTSQPPF